VEILLGLEEVNCMSLFMPGKKGTCYYSWKHCCCPADSLTLVIL
jgi:hypothetical protein